MMAKRYGFLFFGAAVLWGCLSLLTGQQVARAAATQELPGAGAPSAGVPISGALPGVQPLLDARLVDLGDRPISLRALAGNGAGGGRVVVLLHQDRHSSDQNASFKEALGLLAGRYPDRLQVVALADVGGYDFWPAKGYVKDALRPLSTEGGVTVLCDWKGAVRKAYGLTPKQSAVFVLLGGELRHLTRGALSPRAVDSLIGSIEQIVRG